MNKLTRTEQLILDEEGYSEKPYRCPAGKLTIGIGYNLDAGMPLDEAVLLMRHRMDKIRYALMGSLEWFSKLNEARQAALISMAYQMGITGVLGFKRALHAAGRGLYDTASKEMLDSNWARQTPARAQRTAYMMRYGKFPII